MRSPNKNMELIQWKPFNDLDRLVQDFPGPLRKFGTDLSVDLYEEGGNLVAKMNLPGVEATDLEIIVDGDSLTISGDRFEEEETDEKDYYSKEIRRGSFSRMVPLPSQMRVTISSMILVPTRHGVHLPQDSSAMNSRK